MKLHILSDLHLGVGAFEHPETEADAVVLAGDISRPREAIEWALQFAKPVLYVPGNHEYYGAVLRDAARELKALCAGTQVHVLDDDAIVIAGVRFLGSTLWTDFGLFGDGPAQAAAMDEALHLVRDFSRIRTGTAADEVFTPQDSIALFRRHAAWLDAMLDTPHDGPTVVVTHHAPSRRSIHPRFADSLLNACFVSDAEHLARGGRARLWIHGHTHDSFDYRLGDTRVVCNPRGYAKGGVNENPLFDPHLTLDVS